MHLKKTHLLALFAMTMAALVPSPSIADSGSPPPPSTWTLVTSRLDSPRGVDFFHGGLVVAEAGHGGKTCGVFEGEKICVGRSSQITGINLTNGGHTPLVTGLFSALEFHGPIPDALGVDGISARGGKLAAVFGLFPEIFKDFTCKPDNAECALDLQAARSQAGRLISVSRNGSHGAGAPVGSHNYQWTKQFAKSYQEHDANPYGVLAVEGGVYVTDAGSNTLDFVNDGGSISFLHHFHFPFAGFPSDAVPTCVVKTDDALWVADLSGHLFRMDGTVATMVPNTFTKHVTGCTAGTNNDIYFVNMWTSPGLPQPFNGNVVRFKTDEGTWSVVGSPLDLPNMITLGPDGNLYVSADSVCPTAGIQPLCPHGGTVMRMAAPSEDHQSGDD